MRSNLIQLPHFQNSIFENKNFHMEHMWSGDQSHYLRVDTNSRFHYFLVLFCNSLKMISRTYPFEGIMSTYLQNTGMCPFLQQIAYDFEAIIFSAWRIKISCNTDFSHWWISSIFVADIIHWFRGWAQSNLFTISKIDISYIIYITYMIKLISSIFTVEYLEKSSTSLQPSIIQFRYFMC